METTDASIESALSLLRRAARYAADTERSAWDFAVEIETLLALGVGYNDLRWLVCKGYVEHAIETTMPGDGSRTFREGSSLLLPARSCFIVTAIGAALEFDAARCQQEADERPPRIARSSLSTANGQPLTPKWDRYRSELRVGDAVVKQFKVPARNQELVLAAFEEEGWPVRIDDPLPPREEQDTKRRLHETITSLNRNQRKRLVRFMGDGTGQGVRWELIVACESAGNAGRVPCK